MDQIILNFLTENKTEWLSFLMLIITYSGSYLMVSGITFLSILSFYIHKHKNRILPLLISVSGSAITVFILKNIFGKARPAEASYFEPTFSMPSGHAAIAVALYGFILYIIWKHDKHRLKNPFIIFLFVLIILIGFSRLYLGVHYLSDVLVGYLIGFLWLLISIIFSKLKNRLISSRLL